MRYKNAAERNDARNERRRQRYDEKIAKPAAEISAARSQAWRESQMAKYGDDLYTRYRDKMDSIPRVENKMAKINANIKRDITAVVEKDIRKHKPGFIEAATEGSECFSDLYWEDGVATATFRRDGFVLDEDMTRGEFMEWLANASEDGDGLGEYWNAT